MPTDASTTIAADERALGIVGQSGGNQHHHTGRRSQKMKYLVTAKRNLVPMDAKMAIGVFQAAKQWTNAELAAGGMDLTYTYADGSGGFGIGNADSHEDAYDKLLECPYYVFMDWEVIPLVDWSHSFDKLIEVTQKIAAMT
jgi:muconolactone delta-isomerase